MLVASIVRVPERGGLPGQVGVAATDASRRSATYVPLPGRVTTTPSVASSASARDTVTGLTRWACASSRLDGRRSPGACASARSRSVPSSWPVLLSLDMRNK